VFIFNIEGESIGIKYLVCHLNDNTYLSVLNHKAAELIMFKYNNAASILSVKKTSIGLKILEEIQWRRLYPPIDY